jgi:nucleoside-diphosphate-sugar epimerase
MSTVNSSHNAGMHKIIIVTGGADFIGSHFVEALISKGIAFTNMHVRKIAIEVHGARTEED